MLKRPPPPTPPSSYRPYQLPLNKHNKVKVLSPSSPSASCPPPQPLPPNFCFDLHQAPFINSLLGVIQEVKINKLFGSNKFEAGYDPDHQENCSHEHCQFLSEFSFSYIPVLFALLVLTLLQRK